MAHCGTGTLGTKVRITTLFLIGILLTIPTNAKADYTIDTAPTGSPALNNSFGRSDGYSKAAQSFTTTQSGTITSISNLLISAVSSPADDVTISIQADSGGSPSGTALYTSNTIDPQGQNCTTEYTATFGTPPVLSASTMYWVVAQRTGALTTADRYGLCDASGYSGGNKKMLVNGGGWDNFTSDDSKMVINIETAAASATSSATSSIEQTQENVGFGFLLFSVGIGTMWLLFRRSE